MSATPDVLGDQSALVYSLIYQGAPDPVTKEELTERSGLEADELRSALKDLEGHGMIAGDREGYRHTGSVALDLADTPDSPDLPDEADPPDGAVAAEEDGLPPAPMPAGPGAGRQIRVSLGLLATYGAARGESDESATKKAQAIAAEVGNVLATAMPNLNFHVDVSMVEAFDSPRRVWPPAGGEEEQ